MLTLHSADQHVQLKCLTRLSPINYIKIKLTIQLFLCAIKIIFSKLKYKSISMLESLEKVNKKLRFRLIY